MSTAVKAMLEACRSDDELRGAVTSAATVQELVDIARAHGFEVDPADVLAVQDDLQADADRDVSDAELEGAAGGQALTRGFACDVTLGCPLVQTWALC